MAMEVKVVIGPDGKLQAFIEKGTYEAGKKELEKFLAGLGADGIEFAEIGTVEQHRHDTETAHTTAHTHSHI